MAKERFLASVKLENIITFIYSEKYIELGQARNITLQVGTKNGQKNGLELLVDVESFEYSYYPRGGRGFIIGLSDLGERNIIRQEGCFLSFQFPS